MEFVPPQLIDHLVAAGLLAPGEIVDDGIRIEHGFGRNVNYRVVRGDGSGWFLKTAPAYAPAARAAVAREGAFYDRVRRDRGWSALRDFVPGFVRFDHEAHVLALDLMQGAGNAHEFEDDSGSIMCAPIGALLGAALAACHSVPCDDWPDTTLGGERKPWVFDVAKPRPRWLDDVSMGELKIVNAVQADPDLCRALDALRDDWTPSSLTHGDVKWGNVLVRVEGNPPTASRVWLADWEGAFRGDPAWDVGSALHSFLADVIHHVTEAADSPAEAGRAFRERLPAARVEIRAFWDAYTRARPAGGSVEDALLGRSIRMCGARLIQSAVEWAPAGDGVPRSAATALQLASRILRAPDVAARELFALAAELQ